MSLLRLFFHFPLYIPIGKERGAYQTGLDTVGNSKGFNGYPEVSGPSAWSPLPKSESLTLIYSSHSAFLSHPSGFTCARRHCQNSICSCGNPKFLMTSRKSKSLSTVGI